MYLLVHHHHEMEQEESCKHNTGNIEHTQKSAVSMPAPPVRHTFGYSVYTLLQMCLGYQQKLFRTS